MIYEENVFQEFVKDRNINKSSQKVYSKSLKPFLVLNDMTLTELIDEADNEEEEGIRLKRRKLGRRLKEYRNYLIENDYEVSTIKTYFSNVKTFYRNFEIEIPYLPPVILKKKNHERYEDIPQKKHIREAVESTNNVLNKALILFMSSSGSALQETINLTINDFIQATSDYNNKLSNIHDVINTLESKKDIVPLFAMLRQKTDFPYYTCCSPEAVTMIIRYLKTRKKLSEKDPLFDIQAKSVMQNFKRINEKIGWGKVNHYCFFHSHSLRKFHATAIEETGLANTLQGRKADKITETYFKHNPKRIREKYIEHLPRIAIENTMVNVLDDEGYKKLKKLEKEIQILQNENKEFKDIIHSKLKL